MNSTLHAGCAATGRPGCRVLSAGQMSEDPGAGRRLPFLPHAPDLMADRGDDADWFRGAVKKKGVLPCIPPRKRRRKQPRSSHLLSQQRHTIEILVGRIKDWRRIALRDDRWAHTVFSAICLAAVFIFYLKE